MHAAWTAEGLALHVQAVLQEFKEARGRKKTTQAVNKNAVGGTGTIELYDEEFTTA